MSPEPWLSALGSIEAVAVDGPSLEALARLGEPLSEQPQAQAPPLWQLLLAMALAQAQQCKHPWEAAMTLEEEQCRCSHHWLLEG